MPPAASGAALAATGAVARKWLLALKRREAADPAASGIRTSAFGPATRIARAVEPIATNSAVLARPTATASEAQMEAAAATGFAAPAAVRAAAMATIAVRSQSKSDFV